MVAFSAVFSTALFLVALPALANPTPEPSTDLFARQTNGGGLFDPSTIPSTCKDSCTSVENNLNGCPDLSCLCSSTIVQGIASCLDCGVSIKSSALNATYAQNLINTYIASCNQGGANVSPVTIKGSSTGTSSGSGSSGSGASRIDTMGGAALAAAAFIFYFA